MNKEETEQENKLLKTLLYCTQKSCNNCGKVNCENFQRQRIAYCELWISYIDRIKNLEQDQNVKDSLLTTAEECCANIIKNNETEYERLKLNEQLAINNCKILLRQNEELKRVVKMVAMINKGIYSEDGIKAIYAEAENLIKEE